MTETKIDMEEECQKLQDNLKQLTEDRNLLREEFAELNSMYRDLIVQLREDTLAGEGQLHTFQSEKKRMEDRLEQLELQIQEKNEKMLELDSKASDYLLRVTTASNTLYDDDEQTDQQKQTQMNLIQKLVYEDMVENDEVTANEEDDEESGEADDEQTQSDNSGEETESSETENVPSVKIRLNDEPIPKETVEAMKHKTEVKESQGGSPSVDLSSSTGEEMKSLSSLVEELKKVKDEMGRCISSKEESFMELEGQLQATKKELAILRGSMSDLSIELHKREEGYISSDRDRSSDRISLSHDDKFNLMHKIGILESMVTDDRVDLEELLLEKRSESGEDSREMSPCFLRSNLQSPSACSISGRVALLERELNEANEKLARSRRRMKVLSMEREHKQRECDMLQRKVDRVESKMCELQGTFDALVKALMLERDELVNEMKAKNFKIELLQSKISQMENSPSANQLADRSLYIGKEEHDAVVKAIETKYSDQLAVCQNSLRELEVNHSKEIERLKGEINSSNDTRLSQINDLKAQISQMEQENKEKLEILNVTRSETESERKLTNEMRASMEMHQTRAQMLEKIIDDKTKENDELKKKVNLLEAEKSDFAPRLQEEMDRIKEEASKANEDKTELMKTFKELQEEQKETLRLNSELSAKLEAFEKEKRQFGSVEELKQQLEEQTQKLTTLNSLNDKLSSQLNNKEQVMKEEICAREATIQELGVTLRNNQKQSRENYQMLQDEMAALQLLQKKEKEENEALISHLKEKIIKSEEESEKYLLELNELKQKKENNSEEESKVETETSATLEESNSEEARSTPLTTPEENKPQEMSEENFQKELKSKQDEVNLLEERVSSLEQSLREKSTCVTELESKIKSVEIEDSYKSRFEQQMDQIKKLNDFIDELKVKVDQLNSTSSELQQTVDQLMSEKNRVEGEKESLVKELEDLKISSETLENDLETKKKLG